MLISGFSTYPYQAAKEIHSLCKNIHCVSTHPHESHNTKETEMILQKKLDSISSSKIVPGVTLSVRYKDDSRISLVSGLADIEDNEILKSDAVMFSNSVGKNYFAAVALKLYEDGKIDLKAKSVDYLRYEG